MGKHPSDEVLSRYADGDLKGRRKEGLMRHLKECPACRNRLAEIRSIRIWAETLEPVEVPPGLFAGIRACVTDDERTQAYTSKPQGVLKGVALTAAFAVVLAGLLVLPHTVPPSPAENVATMLPSDEILGPPVGLANAQEFGQYSSIAVDLGSGAQTVALETYLPDSEPNVILVPLDDVAKRNIVVDKLKSPGFFPGVPSFWFEGKPEEGDCVVVVKETVPR